MGNKKYRPLVPKFYPQRNCWMVDVPASQLGKRTKFFYPTQEEAYKGSCEIGLKLATGATIFHDAGDRKIKRMVPMFLAMKEAEVGYDTARQIRWALKRLVEKFGDLPVDALTPKMVKQWVVTSDLQTRGKFNLFACCRSFYNWEELEDLCPKNPFRDSPAKKDKNDRMEILTVDQCRALLDHPWEDKWFKAWIVGGMFAGLRPCELRRISYEAFDYEDMEIAIRREDSKGGKASRPRPITIRPALKRHMPTGKGLICEGKTNRQFEPLWKEAAGLLGLKTWPKNILRHTAASHMLSESRDASRTALEMGHTSPTLLFETYANAVTKKETAEFWGL